MNKKGAIEFSMTTIMVVIIGVAVLALGLAWIRGTFEQVGTITEGSLEAAETIVGEVAFSGKASAPATIVMKSKDAKKFKVLVRNQDSGPTAFKVDIGTITENPAANGCLSTSPAEGSSLSTITIEGKGIGEFVGGILSDDCDNKVGILPLTIKKGAVVYSTESVTIQAG